jgi:hypothetical protein
MKNLYTFVEFIRKSLVITKPVEIRIVSSFKGEVKDAAAFCDTRLRKNKILKHVLVFSMERMETYNYNYLNVAAHELIHASMIENGQFNDDYHHDKLFQKLADKLQHTLEELGFDIGSDNLYDPELDTE